MSELHVIYRSATTTKHYSSITSIRRMLPVRCLEKIQRELAKARISFVIPNVRPQRATHHVSRPLLSGQSSANCPRQEAHQSEFYGGQISMPSYLIVPNTLIVVRRRNSSLCSRLWVCRCRIETTTGRHRNEDRFSLEHALALHTPGLLDAAFSQHLGRRRDPSSP